MSEDKPVAAVLLQTGLSVIQAAASSEFSRPWQALVLAQQASLDGHFDASLALSLASVEAGRRDATLTHPVALACAMAALFHRGLLKACPLALDQHGDPGQLDRRRVYAEAFRPLLALQTELGSLKCPHMPAGLQAQVDRIHVVLDAVAGRESSQPSRLRLLVDGAAGHLQTTHVGQALLCSALAHRLRDDRERAAQCLAELAALSAQLSWGLGRWVALCEASMLQAASGGGAPPSAAEIGAMVGPGFSSWLLQSPASSGGAQQEAPRVRVEQAKAFIRGSLGQRFSVADVAARCHVSARTLGQDFKDVEGMTPLEYITRQKVVLAEQLLAQRQLTLKTVANAVGFETVLGFSKAYARVTGRTPVQQASR